LKTKGLFLSLMPMGRGKPAPTSMVVLKVVLNSQTPLVLTTWSIF
jgi:hypothetical protein